MTKKKRKKAKIFIKRIPKLEFNEVLDSGRKEMEIKVIKEILFSPRIKQKELAEQVGTSVSTIQRTIKKLVKEGKIVRVNGKRDGYWKIFWNEIIA